MGETGVPRGERLEADEPVSQRGLLNRLDESRLNTEGGLPPHAPLKFRATATPTPPYLQGQINRKSMQIIALFVRWSRRRLLSISRPSFLKSFRGLNLISLQIAASKSPQKGLIMRRRLRSSSVKIEPPHLQYLETILIVCLMVPRKVYMG